MENIDFCSVARFCEDLLEDPIFHFDMFKHFQGLYSGPADRDSIYRFLSNRDAENHNELGELIKSWLIDDKPVTWSPLFLLLLRLRLEYAADRASYLQIGSELGFQAPSIEYAVHWALANLWIASSHARLHTASCCFSFGLPPTRERI